MFENTHEAIIDADTWARVQELRKNKRRPTRTGKTNMFSGIVRCADCGEKLYYCTSKNFEARQDHFVCSTSRLKGKEVCSTHFIRAVVLEQGVLAHLRLVISCVANHEEQFRKAMGAKQKADAKKELAAKRRQATQMEQRIEELDRLFKRIYEDNANGKLSDSRFQMLSDDYEQEQEELREKLLQLNEEIIQQEEQAENIDRFIGKVQKYLDLDELTPTVLNDMVKAVYVHAPDKSKGYREQQIDISYDLCGNTPRRHAERPKKRSNGITEVTPLLKIILCCLMKAAHRTALFMCLFQFGTHIFATYNSNSRYSCITFFTPAR